MTNEQLPTICALATPPGVAGLAVIRVSGATAISVCSSLFVGTTELLSAPDHTIHYGWWSVANQRIDAVTCTVFRAPHSYTGEDVVEIGCHGGVFVVDQIIDSLITTGSARLAEPGEFTRRAFLNGKLDLTQAEAVADLIHAQTRAGSQTAARQLAGGFTARLSKLRDTLISASGLLEVELDFSEEGYEFVGRPAFLKALDEGIAFGHLLANSAKAAEILRSGFYCAVVGYPNAGKSSLFNALLDRTRAIVSHIPGTTRDYLEESVIVDGYTIHVYDTAGLRNTQDTIELQGIVLTSSLLEQSNLILVVNDASLGFDHSDELVTELAGQTSGVPIVVIQNKMDLVQSLISPLRETDIPCSTVTGDGLSALRSMLASAAKSSSAGLTDVLVNARQATLLKSLVEHLESARSAIQEDQPADLIAIDLRAGVRILGEISGETWNPDILDSVFSRFCIGK